MADVCGPIYLVDRRDIIHGSFIADTLTRYYTRKRGVVMIRKKREKRRRRKGARKRKRRRKEGKKEREEKVTRRRVTRLENSITHSLVNTKRAARYVFNL